MVRVIGAGFGRTGTHSVQAALERLGFAPCYHMRHVIDNAGHAEQWLSAAEGRSPDWQALLAGCEATMDWPAAAFWRQLMHAFPQAKLLLTVRDPDRWYDSTLGTIYAAARPGGPAEALPPAMREANRVADAIIWQGTFGGRFEDREHANGVFRRHIEEVERDAPPERLLVMEVGDGWAPLCDFLGVAAPDEPFPNLSDGSEFRAMMEGRRERT